MHRLPIASTACQRGKFSWTKLRLVEGLEAKRQERVQLLFVLCVGQADAVADRLAERAKVGVVFRVQGFLLDELPESLDEVQIGRVGRQVDQLDLQRFGHFSHHGALLISGVVQNQTDRHANICLGDLPEQLTHTGCVDVRIIGHGYQFMRDGVQSTKHIEALPTGRRFNEATHETP